jgi:uridylate kinase
VLQLVMGRRRRRAVAGDGALHKGMEEKEKGAHCLDRTARGAERTELDWMGLDWTGSLLSLFLER